MASLKIYSKEQTDALLQNKANASDLPASEQLVPTTSGASQGDVLTVGASGTEWSTPSASGGMAPHTYTSWAEFVAAFTEHGGIIFYHNIPDQQYTSNIISGFANVLKSGNNIYLNAISSILIPSNGNMGLDQTNIEIGMLNGEVHIYQCRIHMYTSTSISGTWPTFGGEATTSLYQIYPKSLASLNLNLEDIIIHYY